MSETLDKFLPPFQTQPKQDEKIVIQEKCAKCGKSIPLTEPKYTLKIKGKEAPYCQNCTKKILRPQENQEEQCINSLTVFRTSKNKCENLGKS